MTIELKLVKPCKVSLLRHNVNQVLNTRSYYC